MDADYSAARVWAVPCSGSQNSWGSSKLCDDFNVVCVSSKLTKFVINEPSDRLPDLVPPKPHFSVWWKLITRKIYYEAERHRAASERLKIVLSRRNDLAGSMGLTWMDLDARCMLSALNASDPFTVGPRIYLLSCKSTILTFKYGILAEKHPMFPLLRDCLILISGHLNSLAQQ